MILNEGMRSGDLRNLMLPIVSCDEYCSKIDDSSIVIGFYVHDQDAADDLNRFIQRSFADILDSEVSPAPNQKGYYMVFVEILSGPHFTETVEILLSEILMLVEFDEWKMELRGEEGIKKFDIEMLKQFNKAKDVTESVYAFLAPSQITDARIEGSRLTIVEGRAEYHYDILSFCSEQTATELLSGAALSITLTETIESSRLQMALGYGWDASAFNGKMVLRRNDCNTALILKNPND